MESKIEREGLRKNKTYPFIQKKLTTLSFSLGTAYGRNDCFFDAVAQGIERTGIIIPGDNKHTGYKKLRVLCNKYFKDQEKQGDTSWLKASVKADAEFGGDNYNTCCVTLQYTQAEISELYKKRTLGYKNATRGRPHIEGKILCEQFGIKLHVIEFQDAAGIEEVEEDIITVHQLVTSEGSKTLGASPIINHDDSDTIYIAAYGDHFVPLFSARKKEEKKGIEKTLEGAPTMSAKEKTNLSAPKSTPSVPREEKKEISSYSFDLPKHEHSLSQQALPRDPKEKKENPKPNITPSDPKAWLAAASGGDCTRLNKMLDDKQDIDEIVDGQTALQAAIKAKKYEAVKLLLKRNANPGVLTPNGTALIVAIKEYDADTFELLLGKPAGQAALNIVHVDKDGSCYTPFTYLRKLYDKPDEKQKSKLGKMLELSLKKRPAFWPRDSSPAIKEEKSEAKENIPFSTDLELLAHFYNLHEKPNDPQHNSGLRHYIIARLTGQDINKILTKKIDNVKTREMVLCALMNMDGYKYGQEVVRGWNYKPFLTIRIASLFNLWYRFHSNKEPIPQSLGPSKKELCTQLAKELLINLEILRNAQEVDMVYNLPKKYYKILAKKLADKISQLSNGDEYSLVSGWDGDKEKKQLDITYMLTGCAETKIFFGALII